MNRKNLRHFISMEGGSDEKPRRRRIGSTKGTLTYVASDIGISATKESQIGNDDEDEELDMLLSERTLFLVPENPNEKKRQLSRLNTCAVFHKLTSGRGVPHTFYGFLRQWPALPRVVVRSRSVCLSFVALKLFIRSSSRSRL